MGQLASWPASWPRVGPLKFSLEKTPCGTVFTFSTISYVFIWSDQDVGADEDEACEHGREAQGGAGIPASADTILGPFARGWSHKTCPGSAWSERNIVE